jgi:hypothetical protein
MKDVNISWAQLYRFQVVKSYFGVGIILLSILFVCSPTDVASFVARYIDLRGL